MFKWTVVLAAVATVAVVLFLTQPWNTSTPGVADNAVRLRFCDVSVDMPVDVLAYSASIVGRRMAGLSGGWGGDKPLADDSVLALSTGRAGGGAAIVFYPTGQVAVDHDPQASWRRCGRVLRRTIPALSRGRTPTRRLPQYLPRTMAPGPSASLTLGLVLMSGLRKAMVALLALTLWRSSPAIQ